MTKKFFFIILFIHLSCANSDIHDFFKYNYQSQSKSMFSVITLYIYIERAGETLKLDHDATDAIKTIGAEGKDKSIEIKFQYYPDGQEYNDLKKFDRKFSPAELKELFIDCEQVKKGIVDREIYFLQNCKDSGNVPRAQQILDQIKNSEPMVITNKTFLLISETENKAKEENNRRLLNHEKEKEVLKENEKLKKRF